MKPAILYCCYTQPLCEMAWRYFRGGKKLKPKHLFFSCVLILCCANINAQDLDDLTIPESSQSSVTPYRLYRTGTTWAFIKLETATGKMWQVVFDVEGEAPFTVELNSQILASGNPGRFTLYPTFNLYNFILLDQISGKTWQVQWGPEEADRAIIPIE